MARKNSTLIIKNLNGDIELETLLNTFKPFGKMNGIRIRSSKKDKSTILGFIEYKSIDEATNVLEEIKKRSPLKINNSELEIDYAIREESQRFKNNYSAIVTGLNSFEIKDEEVLKLLGCLKLNQRNDNVIAYFKTYDDLKKALQEESKIINGKKVTILKN